MGTSSEEFVRLFDGHARVVYNYCFRRTGKWMLAEDLTSAVFLEAWRRRDQVDLCEANAMPWLLGVATNLLRNQRRSLRRHAAALRRLPPESIERDFSDDLVDRLAAEEHARLLLGQLHRLPRGQQDVVALCWWEGLSYEEAALALGIPIGTVRSRLERGRRRLEQFEVPDNIVRGPIGERPVDGGVGGTT